jgi:hypothetical protein
MNKENIFAITFGLVLGIVVALVLWTSRGSKIDFKFPQISLPNINFSLNLGKSQTSSQPSLQVSIVPTQATQKEIKLEISYPEDEITLNAKTLEIKGKADPKSTVIISFEDQDILISQNQDGTFMYKTELSPGPNSFVVTSISSTKSVEQVERTIIYEATK